MTPAASTSFDSVQPRQNLPRLHLKTDAGALGWVAGRELEGWTSREVVTNWRRHLLVPERSKPLEDISLGLAKRLLCWMVEVVVHRCSPCSS